MVTITVRTGFNASHSVQIGPGSRETPHGHDWLVEVEVGADELDEHGLVMDFHQLERILGECLADFQGALLDELPEFADRNPTAEQVARTIFERVNARLSEDNRRLVRTTVWETHTCGATYRPA